MCTRILCETGTGTYITGRGVDWGDPSALPKLYAYPRGMKQDGGVGERSLRWTSKYGSVCTALYDQIDVDGFNEKGLAADLANLQLWVRLPPSNGDWQHVDLKELFV